MADSPTTTPSIAAANAALTGPGSPFEIDEAIIAGRATKVWKHALPTLRDAFLAGRAHGAAPFLVFEQERVSFDQFCNAAIALAQDLVRRGVGKGDRVAIAMRNLPEWPVAFYGSLLAGAIVTPLNAWWLCDELEYGLVSAGARVLIGDTERLNRIAPRLGDCPALAHVLAVRPQGTLPGGAEPFDGVCGPVSTWGQLPPGKIPNIPIHPDDAACILFTSGTTGRPKGALASHRNIMSGLTGAAFSAARMALRTSAPAAPPRPEGRRAAMLLSAPLFHANGCFAQLTPALAAGAKVVLMRRWDVDEAMRLIECERVTHAGGVPTMALQLADRAAGSARDLSSLESVAWGGAPTPPDLAGKIRDSIPSAQAGNGWGMTETSGAVTMNLGADYLRRPDSAGTALPVWAIKIAGPEGQGLPTGQVGELWAKGPGVIKGYWNDPEATAATLVDGWVRTGDLARLDEEGFLFIVDRIKDMLIRGGENIYCVEVENVLYQHPDVLEAAVVGIPHETLGEVPGAIVFVTPGAGLDEEALRRFAAQRLAAYKAPVRIVFRDQPLPRNPSGKILKHELRGAFADPPQPRSLEQANA